MSEKYDHRAIESKWQKRWESERVFSVTTPDPSGTSRHLPSTRGGSSAYVLDMFPYPSGDGLHVGHPEGYTATDIYSRYLRMKGKIVLHPMGWDAFGLPAENAAIKKGIHPRLVTEQNVQNFKRQIQSLGFSYDWDREVNTTDPKYYKWTQWIFLQLFKKGLAYEKEMAIWWCPKDKTGLANEEVVNGKCDRCGTPVEKKMLKQWMLKITAYADRLISGLDNLDWPENIKTLQRNWIGRSEGAEVDFLISQERPAKYVLLHGYTSGPNKHMFPWLKERLEQTGAEVLVPQLPNPDDPVVSDQVEEVLKSGFVDQDTVLLGHSLGGVVALKLLEKLPFHVKRTILISSYAENRFLNNELFEDHTFDWKFNGGKIKENAGDLTILRDVSDEIVPADQADILQKLFGGGIVDFQATVPHAWGEKEPGVLNALFPKVTVFTTRPDTLFGATYLVLSPEHELVAKITTPKQKKAVEKYVKSVAAKSDLERTSLEKEKTGVFTGAYAINPANQEKIPVWIADYVLASYGTGAIMAVPAHDERDWEFAKKFGLPINQVIAPMYENTTDLVPRPELPTVTRRVVYIIVQHPKQKKILCLKWKKQDWQSFVMGGIEGGEDVIKAARREVLEETGYKNLEVVDQIDWQVHTLFFAPHKNENRYGVATAVVLKLKDEDRDEIAAEERELHESVWVDIAQVRDFVTHGNAKALWDYYQQPFANSGEGILVNSGEFDGQSSTEGRKNIVDWLVKEGKAEPKIQYKLRDWVFSRQRYWGEPIPLVHCQKCGVVPVPEDQLPVLLPEVEKYEPTGTGESPLAAIDEWVNTTCPNCDGPAKRETNTMPQWAGSCWYYLRFCDPKNTNQFASAEALKAWLPVDLYVGGAEHAVLHLLYSRFWHMVLYDIGAIPKTNDAGQSMAEPFLKLKNQGLILGPDGEKMSKSRGNVINPDEIIAKFGADTLRMYEMFMGPFEDAKPWDTNGIIGVWRFLDRIWRVTTKDFIGRSLDTELKKPSRSIHKTVKRVTEAIEKFNFNTAISDLMIFFNGVNSKPDWREKAGEGNAYDKKAFEKFIKILAPFAPHIAQELWEKIGNSTLLAKESWPEYSPNKIIAESVEVIIQVNGKLRAVFLTDPGRSQESIELEAKKEPNVKKYLTGQPKKVVFVPDKLINFVI